MKKFILSICILWLALNSVLAVTVTYPDDFKNGWESYMNQTVTFSNRFYVIGYIYENGYTGLYLLPEQLRAAWDVFTPGTIQYDSLDAANKAAWNDKKIALKFNANTGAFWELRQGAYVDNLEAKITAENALSASSFNAIPWHARPTQRPDLGDASLIVCGANLQNFTPWYAATYTSESAPKTKADSERQTAKVMAALQNIDADIYAFCELQDTAGTVDFIAQKLNALCGVAERYAGVNDNMTNNNIAAGRTGFVYRTDKVKPVGVMGYPDPTNSVYSRHQYVQQFEELASGGRFALSINHFKAKTTNSDQQRITNMTNLINWLNAAKTNKTIDDDVLVMGDLNTYSKEQPILMLEAKNYTNQLTRFNPAGYSYYAGVEIGNMDHALASESLGTQVTGAAVYQLNAGEQSALFGWGGTKQTTDMYAYSDHNPVLVGLRLNAEPEPVCENISISESFSSSLGTFTSVNVTGGNDWYWHSSYKCAYMSGYSSAAENEDWLVSPNMDLRGKEKAVLTFQHAINRGSASTIQTGQTLWITENYTGNPATSTWEQVAIPNYPTSLSWNWISNTITLPAKYIGKENVVIGFKYVCSAVQNDVNTWEIKNVTLKANCLNDGLTYETENTDLVYSRDKTIFVENVADADVRVYDVFGRMVAQGRTVVEVPVSGVYIVSVKGAPTKVLVK